jgi:Domain of unknown function (DUF6924)
MLDYLSKVLPLAFWFQSTIRMFPQTQNTPLIRTDFTNEKAWQEVVDATERAWEDGFRPLVSIINDVQFDGLSVNQLAELGAGGGTHSILLVADSTTMHHPERPVLCFDLMSSKKPFRVILPELWAVENNLSLANLEYDDFAGSVDADGIFRGFD